MRHDRLRWDSDTRILGSVADLIQTATATYDENSLIMASHGRLLRKEWSCSSSHIGETKLRADRTLKTLRSLATFTVNRRFQSESTDRSKPTVLK